MTEYTTSSQAIREHMTAHERTAYWVQSHSPDENEFYSPSVLPSELGEYLASPLPSEADSIRSVPPKMVLRWGDGRPDLPIPIAEESRSRSRRRRENSTSRSPPSPASATFPQNPHHRVRAGSHGSSPLARLPPHSSDRYSERSPLAPEEIRVLPSQGNTMPQASSSHQPRSKSLPRTTDLHSHVPPLPGPMPPPQGSSSHQVPFTAQPWHTYTQGRPHHPQKQPPAIIYAPSHTSSRPRYAPPAIYHHPPQMGPNGMTYSHSAPVPSSSHRNPYTSGLPSSMVPPSHTLATIRDDERAATWSGRAARERSRPARLRSPSSSSSSLGSNGSGSTYYVLPSAGQKVHVIAPSPQPSINTATSTTRSPTSPRSGSFKKPPFLQRLFNFASRFSSAGSSTAGGRRLQRRHSTGTTGHRLVAIDRRR